MILTDVLYGEIKTFRRQDVREALSMYMDVLGRKVVKQYFGNVRKLLATDVKTLRRDIDGRIQVIHFRPADESIAYSTLLLLAPLHYACAKTLQSYGSSAVQDKFNRSDIKALSFILRPYFNIKALTERPRGIYVLLDARETPKFTEEKAIRFLRAAADRARALNGGGG